MAAGRGRLLALRRLAYLGVTNVLAMLRLLPMSDRAKDVEILLLRHQITVLERQLHGQRIRFTAADRAIVAALLHRLPRTVLHQIRLLVLPRSTTSPIRHHVLTGTARGWVGRGRETATSGRGAV